VVEPSRDEVVRLESLAHSRQITRSDFIVGVDEQKLVPGCRPSAEVPRMRLPTPPRRRDDAEVQAVREALGDSPRAVARRVIHSYHLPPTVELLARERAQLLRQMRGGVVKRDDDAELD
jgi:hypothetical protein